MTICQGDGGAFGHVLTLRWGPRRLGRQLSFRSLAIHAVLDKLGQGGALQEGVLLQLVIEPRSA